MITRISLALIGVIFCLFQCSIASVGQTIVLPAGKGVELTFEKNPTKVITMSDQEAHGFWTPNLERAPDSKATAGKPKVDFLAQLVDGRAELRVSIFFGEPVRGTETRVATYTIADGESVVLSELAKHGFIPPRARMVTVPPSLAQPPIIRNTVRSLQPRIDVSTAPLPLFSVVMKNVSTKPIIAIAYQMIKEGRGHGTLFLHGKFGSPLIEPGSTPERPIYVSAEESRGGDLIVDVDAVFFGDGTFEGEPHHAARFMLGQYVRKDVLGRINVLFGETLRKMPSRADVRRLIAAVEADTAPAPDAILLRLRTEFPRDANLEAEFRGRSKVARDAVRGETLNALRNLERAAVGRSDQDVNSAFARLAEHFQDWAGRLP